MSAAYLATVACYVATAGKRIGFGATVTSALLSACFGARWGKC